MGGKHKDLEYHKKWWEKNKHKYTGPRKRYDPDYDKKYYEANKDSILLRQRKRREDNPEHRLLKSAQGSAIKRGLDFNIEISDVVIPEMCPILKVPMLRFTDYAPSIDRIDNNLGYVKGNVQVISRKANSMKYSATATELLSFATWVVDNYTPVNIEELKQT